MSRTSGRDRGMDRLKVVGNVGLSGVLSSPGTACAVGEDPSPCSGVVQYPDFSTERGYVGLCVSGLQ